MPAVLGLVHPVANLFHLPALLTIQLASYLRRDPHDLRTAAAAPNLTCSHDTAEKPDEITFLFGLFNFQKPSFPEASQQTSSHVSLVRIVSH